MNLTSVGDRFQNLGEMMTLGRNDAAVSPSFIDGLTIEGPIGHTGKVLFVPCCCVLIPMCSYCSSVPLFLQQGK